MKKAYLLLIFALVLAACGSSGRSGEPLSACKVTLSDFYDVQASDIPTHFQVENPAKQGGEIDVMDYFSVLDHLSMAPGFRLDYVYHFDGMGGYPLLYALPTDQEPYATEADMPGAGEQSYLEYVELDDTAESYFQYVLLANYGSQFYLFWHANYNDTQILCNRADVNSIVADKSFGLSIPFMVRLRASLLHDLAPTVTFYEDTVEVRMITFTKWGGFYVETYTLERTSPTRILDVQQKNIIHYDCGIMF